MTSGPATDPAAVSPSSSGPAGALFEAEVAAHYLLTMLADGEPRGLPGTLIERIEMQRAGEGYPLDDVIVCGLTGAGDPAVLEIQVKRTITFAPKDVVFKDVIAQLAGAVPKLDRSHTRHQFAVATARASSKITGPYQDLLRWAREVSSAAIFIKRIESKNVGNEAMRSFVSTIRSHLAAFGCPEDDETVWEVLRRFQILIFDYDAPGSQAVELAHERARHVLELRDRSRASALWKTLTETALNTAASGGDLDASRLRAILADGDGFHLLGSRRNRKPRDTLSEEASLIAADLRRDIAGVTIGRSAQLDSIRSAREVGRYVEIRGAPGVGKSGLLGTLIEQVVTEGRAIVLSPERTIAGGWVAFKLALGIEEAARTFLSDLASDGGAVLFVDGLDFFDDSAKRATVVDLVRAAADVPNLQVIVTARTEFDVEQANWLPSDILVRLGRAPPVLIQELGTDEVNELSEAAPALRALLADDHPARAIARNLFRLSRLLEAEGSAEQLRSEVDLLERWWKTADGGSERYRERARLLADLSEAALAGAEYLQTRAEPVVIDDLISSGTLKELGLDRLTFRHDVLREWGIAARLHEDPTKLEHLPLTRAAPASLARAVELGARLALERSDDDRPWLRYLLAVSSEGAHPSWRRWSLLAIVRSEIASMLLDRAAGALFEQEGALLKELIRTVLAAESQPLAEMLAASGADVDSIPADLYAPNNASWFKLVRWLLAHKAELPIQAIPEIIELFLSLSASFFFRDPLTPKVAELLGGWLVEIEDAQDRLAPTKDPSRFTKAYAFGGLNKLAETVRHAFALMAARVPDLAQTYLRRVIARRDPEYAIRDIMRVRGSFAQAAPAELAELTLVGLTPDQDESGKHSRRARSEPLSQLDTDFIPSSPAQGPFLDLLNASPTHGLDLIRRLVDLAIAAQTNEEKPGDDGFELIFSSGRRFVPWMFSYIWSRNADGSYAVESGLMALEAWSHVRIERGDPVDQVIADILGPEGSPAAFVLVAVDVLISQWPKTMSAATPFLGSPALLSLDRTRLGREYVSSVDFLGVGAIAPKEPVGPIRMASLRKRPSRRFALDYVLGLFKHADTADHDRLRNLLEDASSQLGPIQPNDTFAEPRLMARHALNILDTAHWRVNEDTVEYVPPPDEAKHIADLQLKRAAQNVDRNVEMAIHDALENAERSSPELVEKAVSYAKRRQAEPPEAGSGALQSPTGDMVSIAMIVARDGTDKLLDEHERWTRSVFAQVLAATNRSGGGFRDGIRFRPSAIATLGVIYLWRRRRLDADRDLLLELAGRGGDDVAQGFGAGLDIVRRTDVRLVPALLRCAFSAQIRPSSNWNDPEERKTAERARHQTRVLAAIEAERAWLRGDANEPAWPPFPPHRMRGRGGRTIPGEPRTNVDPTRDELYSHSAAQWLRLLGRDLDKRDESWLKALVMTYSDWTIKGNGAGLPANTRADDQLDDWTRIFFDVLVRTLMPLTPSEAVAELAPTLTVPDEAFFEIAAAVIRATDLLYFNELGLARETAIALRNLMADRLIDSSDWRHERDRSEPSVGLRIGPALGALFFNHYSFADPQCYLTAKGVDRVGDFLPYLERSVANGPVPFTALLTMNLLEVSHKPEHMAFFLSSATTWLRRQPNNSSLWINLGFGARLAKWVEHVAASDATFRSPDHPLRARIDDLLARLVQAGVAEARRVERLLVRN